MIGFLEKISNLILIIRCFLRFLFFGKANKINKNPSCLIVVLSGKLGDVVCSTPVLQAIRENLPNTKIILGRSTKMHEQLLADSGLVDDYLDFNAPSSIFRIRKIKAEAAIVTGPSFYPTALLYLAGLPFIVAPTVVDGFSPAETKPYRILKKMILTFPYSIKEYAPRERLRALEYFNINSSNTKKHLGYSKGAVLQADLFFEKNNINPKEDFIVAISPVAGNKIKEWPIDRFAKIADYFIQKYKTKVVLIGTEGDKETVLSMINHMEEKNSVINSAGMFSIDVLKAFISKIHMLVSVDTGPIYIAEAFEIPTIDIVGPVDEKVQPPQGFIHRNVFWNERKKPAISILNSRQYDVDEARKQVLSIKIEDVKNATDLLISDLNY